MLWALITAVAGVAALVALSLNLRQETRNSRAKYKKLYSQKKQSEVRLGQITEQLVPFLNFPMTLHALNFWGSLSTTSYFRMIK